MLVVTKNKILGSSSYNWLGLFFNSSNAVSNVCKDNALMHLTIVDKKLMVSVCFYTVSANTGKYFYVRSYSIISSLYH